MVVSMQDQKDQSNILLHELNCAKIDRMHVYKLKTDCNGEIDCKWKKNGNPSSRAKCIKFLTLGFWRSRNNQLLIWTISMHA